MCSISWKTVDQQILIVFNRDEQKSRPIASKPRLLKKHGVSSIMPRDPQGGGSWISVNQYGVMLGILNLYEFDQSNKSSQSPDSFVSRGELINLLCLVREASDVRRFFEQQKLAHYRPFRLIFINKQQQIQFLWNGTQLINRKLNAFTSSSSWRSELVVKKRRQSFRDSGLEADNSATEQSLIKLHRDHSERKDGFSICMHRDDAQTVSLSVITIGQSEIKFRYWDGAPCHVKESRPLSIPLIKQNH